MLGEVFERFVEKSPIAVMVRASLERVLGADRLDLWFERTAQKQYTRDLLFLQRLRPDEPSRLLRATLGARRLSGATRRCGGG